MSVGTIGKCAAGVLVLVACGCSAKNDPTPVRYSPDTAAGSGAAGTDTDTSAQGGAGGSTAIDSMRTDNPTQLAPVAGTAVADSGTAGMTADAGDGCVTGQFCQTQKPDTTDCGMIDLKTNVTTVTKPGNVLVVFDRSGSMEEDWNGMPKYQSAGNALISALTPLKALLTVGGIFFPSPPSTAMMPANCPALCLPFVPAPTGCCLTNNMAGSCNVNTIDQPDEINFTTGDAFITALPMQWHITGANGTPLEAGVMQAAAAIKSKTFTDPLIVIIMTDGEPNCGTAQANVLTQISTWKTAGINTHVVGLPGAQGAADLLTMMAQTGGTDTYIDPKDPSELGTRLKTVISSTVKSGFDTCTFKLDPKADVPDKLHLIVTENGMESDVPRNLSKDATWTVNAAGDQVDLAGQLCDFAKDGTFQAIRFVFGCVTQPPLPPPPPPPVLN